MNKLFVKICGITRLEDALYACKAGADAIGFVTWEKSRRFISSEDVKKIIFEIEKIFPLVLKAGIFVNETYNYIESYVNSGINVIQLHGNEAPITASQITNQIKRKNKEIEVWKAFGLKDDSDIEELKNYTVDKILIDAFSPDMRGGTGKSANWELAEKAVKILKKPLILAGGISSLNIKDAVEKVNPYGIDLSSSVEDFPGVKNQMLINDLFEGLKKI